MFDWRRFRKIVFPNSWRPKSMKTKWFLLVVPIVIIVLIVLRVQISLVGYYWDRGAWKSGNFLVHMGYSTASIYDAAVITVNSLRASFENKDVEVNSKLPNIQLRIEPSSLDKMLAAPKISKYYRAQLMYPDGSWHPVQYRLRGRNIWHRQSKKPSLRIKLKKKWPINMQRHINLVVPEDRPMIGNYYGEILAAKFGILTHKTEFVRLFINGEPKGVYHWRTRADESLLIANKRISGLLYVGNHLQTPWQASQFRVVGDKKVLKKINPIKEMVKAIHSPQNVKRYQKLWGVLSKDKYAAWVAINHLVGSIHTDYRHNNLLYFDPSKGLLEPVVSDMLGHGARLYPLYKYRLWQEFKPDPQVPMNELMYPLLDVALRDPKFYHLRNNILYKAITGLGSSSQQIRDLKKIFSKIDRAVFADLYKMSVQNTFVGDYPIPYSNTQYEESKNHVFEWIKKREKFLLNKLLAGHVNISVQKEAIDGMIYFLVEIDGHSSAKFDPAKLKKKVYSDRNLSGTATNLEKSNILLYPGIREYVGSDWNLHTYGDGRHLVPGPQRYLFAVVGDDAAQISRLLKGAFRHSLSGKNISVDVRQVSKLSRSGYAETKSGIHAWQMDQQPVAQIKLGPGIVKLTKDLLVLPGQSLAIIAGTKIRLGKGVSILSWGPVNIMGQPDKKVTFKRLDPDNAWGGLALQGSGASGSSLSYVTFEGGSKPDHPKINYSGMVSVHGSDNVSITNSYFADNVLSDDTLHIVNGHVTLKDLAFKNCFGDCIDFDYASGNLDGLKISDAGNDGLDFMNSEFKVTDFDIDNTNDKGISVGESSTLKIAQGKIKKTNIGIAIKDASRLNADGLKIYENEIAVDLYVKHKLYGRPGSLSVSNTKFKANEVNLRTEEGAEVEFLGQAIPPKVIGDGSVSVKKIKDSR
ncbi:MAG: hypothetical protein HN731_08445 [Rhodospirillaceae bacterium]|nr:hypothetical protein [Rhodospirillaceae bacterium]